MFVVNEQSLEPFIPCEFVPVSAPAAVRIHEAEIFVPRAPVRTPEVRRLGECEALARARCEVAIALAGLEAAESALERQLSELRGYMARRPVGDSHTQRGA